LHHANRMVGPDALNCVASEEPHGEDVLERLDRLKDEVNVLRSRIEQIRPDTEDARVQPDRHRMEAPYGPGQTNPEE
jgi:hypothetical protein